MVCVVSRVICLSLAISGGSCWQRLIGGGCGGSRGVWGWLGAGSGCTVGRV